MTRGAIYEYAAIHHPKKRRDQNGDEIPQKSILIIPVTSVMATSPEEVSIIAARAIPEEYIDKLDDVEIIVRPFAGA